MRIHADHQPYRKKPYVARWYEGTRQRNKFFATEAARDEFIQQLKLTAQRQDPVLPTIAPHKLIRWQQAIAIAPEADPVEVFKFWKSEQRKIAKLGDRYLHDATAAYIQSMENVGRNKSYIGHVRRALADLEAEFGNRLVRDFATEELRDYLFGLPYGAITIKNKRTYFQGAFGWWEQQGWLTENPMKRVESPQIQDKEPEILTVAETRALFRANEKIDPGSGSEATTAPIPKGVGKSAGSSRLERLPGCGPPPSPLCRCSCGKSPDKTTFSCSLNIIGGVRVSP